MSEAETHPPEAPTTPGTPPVSMADVVAPETTQPPVVERPATWGDPLQAALPLDVPGRVQLTTYSLDADRSYAAERDRLSRQYREASTLLLASIEQYDTPGGAIDPEVTEGLENGLSTLTSIAAQLDGIEVPEERAGLAGEHQAFATSITVRAHAIRKALDQAKEHAAVLDLQFQRSKILERNKADGMPWHYGLEEAGVLTLRDAETMGEESYFAGLDRAQKAIARVGLIATQRKLDSRPEFNLKDAVTQGIDASKPAEQTRLTAKLMRNDI